MTDRWVGLTVSTDAVDVFDACVPTTGKLEVQLEKTWKLQAGDRPKAYALMHDRVAQYVRENLVGNVVIMASAATGNTQLVHLQAAELRGVVAAGAAAGGAKVAFVPKSAISRNYGSRKVDEYVGDEGFWVSEVAGTVAKARRDAAMLVLSKTRPRIDHAADA